MLESGVTPLLECAVSGSCGKLFVYNMRLDFRELISHTQQCRYLVISGFGLVQFLAGLSLFKYLQCKIVLHIGLLSLCAAFYFSITIAPSSNSHERGTLAAKQQ